MAEKARAERAKDLRRPVGPADAPLQERGRQLVPREAGNIVLPANPGLSVKDSYWRWPECKPRYTNSGTIDGPNPFTLLTNLNCDGVGYIKPFQIVSSVTNAIANVWTYGALKVYPPKQAHCSGAAKLPPRPFSFFPFASPNVRIGFRLLRPIAAPPRPDSI